MLPQHWVLQGYNPWVYRNKQACILPTEDKRPNPLDLVEFQEEAISTVYFVNDMGRLIDEDGPRYSEILYIPPSITLEYPSALQAYHRLLPYHTMQATVRPDDTILVYCLGGGLSLPPSTVLVITLDNVSTLEVIQNEARMTFPLQRESLNIIQIYLGRTDER